MFKPGHGADGGVRSRKSMTALKGAPQRYRNCPVGDLVGVGGDKAQGHRTALNRYVFCQLLRLVNCGDGVDTLAYEAHGENEARHEGGFVQRQCI